MHLPGHIFLVTATLALSGCGSLMATFSEGTGGESKEQYLNVDRHSSYPALSRRSFEHVNLVELIDPNNDAQSYQMVFTSGEDESRKFGLRYDKVLAWFRTSIASEETKRLHRNGVQDKILAVSTSRCNVYKTFLRRQQSDVNFLLGSATTVSGVLGAVLPGANASRNLAGMAGLFSGVQAEYNQAYYSNLAAQVIIQGIELRQNKLREQLVKGRQDKSIADYSMEAAINDAITIDGTCSATTGLIEAQESIKEVERPGLAMAARTVAAAKALDELNGNSIQDLTKEGRLGSLLEVAGGGVPSLTVTALQPGSLGSTVVSVTVAARLPADLSSYLTYRTSLLGGTYKAARDKISGNGEIVGPAVVEAAFSRKVVPVFQSDSALGVAVKACIAALSDAAGVHADKNARLPLASTPAAIADARKEADIALANLRAILARMEAVQKDAKAAVDARAKAVGDAATEDALKALKTDADVQKWIDKALPKPEYTPATHCS